MGSPYINRFLQPDSIIPDQTNPQSWNRFAYVLNNPINFADPTGHSPACDDGDWDGCGDGTTAPTPPVDPPSGGGGGVNLPPEDDSWGRKDKDVRLPEVLDMMANYQGEKWWSGNTPTAYEWAAFLYGEEGGILKSHNDKIILVEILLYKINRYGPAEFTPATNPIIVPAHEQFNFTQADWNAIVNPNRPLLIEGFSLVLELTSSSGYDITKVPDYLYFVSSDEMSVAGVSLNDFNYNYRTASTYGGGFEVFLQAYEDFCLVTC